MSVSGKCYKTNSQEIYTFWSKYDFFKMWTFPQLPTLMNELVDSPHKPVVLLSFFQNWRFWIGKYFQQNFTENTLSVSFWINTDNIRVNEQHFWLVACFFIAYFIENYYHSLKNLSNFCTRAMVMRLRIQHKYAHTWIAHPSERYFKKRLRVHATCLPFGKPLLEFISDFILRYATEGNHFIYATNSRQVEPSVFSTI